MLEKLLNYFSEIMWEPWLSMILNFADSVTLLLIVIQSMSILHQYYYLCSNLLRMQVADIRCCTCQITMKYTFCWCIIVSGIVGGIQWLGCVLAVEWVLVIFRKYHLKADSRFVPSQWETALLCNDVSHCLDASLGSALLSLCLAALNSLPLWGLNEILDK